MDIEHSLEIDRASRYPINLQLSRQLAWLITGGRLVAGERLPAVRYLAAMLGINLHTVRAAYRHLEEDGLVETRHGSGTYVLPRDPSRPIEAGSGIPGSIFGIVIPAYADLYQRIIDGAELLAHHASALLLVGNARESEAVGLQIVERMTSRGVDGIIVAAPLLPADRAAALARSAQRIVFCDWPNGPLPGIRFDLEGGIAAGVRHLAEHGHRDIGLIAPPAAWANAGPVHTGYRKAMEQARLAPGLIATVYDYTPEAGQHAAAELLDRRPAPTAILASNDQFAVGVRDIAAARGLTVPSDLAVVGFGGGQIGELMTPRLTTVHLPGRRMGGMAMQMLLDEPPDARSPSSTILEPRLVVRESCGCSET
jgi:LacI family transcriptional regulator